MLFTCHLSLDMETHFLEAVDKFDSCYHVFVLSMELIQI